MIHEVTGPEDEARGLLRYDLGNGRFIQLDRRAVEDVGLAKMLEIHRVDPPDPASRVPVKQGGRTIGTVKGDFDPRFIKSTTFLYEPRSGDFTWRGDHWYVSRTLCPGDLEAIPGFVWQRRTQDDRTG